MGKCKHKVSHILADLKQISPQKASSWSCTKYHKIAILYLFLLYIGENYLHYSNT